MAFRVIGSPVARPEGPEKVSGKAIYAADINMEGALWGKILRSPYPHARIRHIDASKARQAPGVKAVITGQEFPGHYIGKMIRDMPVLCWDVVRFVGDRVAAVAADTAEAADEALSLIVVDYEPLPAVFDPVAAMQPDAPQLHPDVAAYDGGPKDKLALDVHNGLTRLAWLKGDVNRGFQESYKLFEHTFHVPARHQGYLEPHAGVVAIDANERIQVWVSAKNPFGIRSQIAKAIDVSEERIRVNAVNVGAEFGGKGDAFDLPVAYFLAKQTGRPIRIVMSYAEELTVSNPAHPTVITVRTGVDRDGHIVARQLRAVHACGAYGALKANASLPTWHYVGVPYRVQHSYFEFLQVYTNTVPGGYYRSPGAIATVFALESHTDLIAEALGMDKAEFRLKNLIGEGEQDAVGQRLCSVRFREVLQEALDASGWKANQRRPNRGVGIAISGRHISGGDTGVILTAESDGSFTVLTPTIDQGSGTPTILRQLVAEKMEIPIEQVKVVIGDTDVAPRDSGVRASRMTYVAGNVVVQACDKLLRQLSIHAARSLECSVEEVEFGEGKFWFRQDPAQKISLHRAIVQANSASTVTVYEDFPYPDDVSYVCAQVAEVEVDRETGTPRVHRITSAHDVGTVINPLTHQGQIDGATVMGVGQSIMEELIIENGQIVNANLGEYKLPTIADIPKLKTVLVSSTGGVGPHDAKPIGEFANNNPPAAIANAVADAVGVRVFDLPITAEKIYRALKQKTQVLE